jgi:hypothetical protein
MGHPSDTTRATRGLAPLAAPAFVAAVWLGMAISAGSYVFKFASPIPFADDFEMIEPATSGSAITAEWLWSAHNEHRVPIARLIYVGLVRVFRDLRAVMYGEVVILAILALAMILVARSIRGRTSYADAFFPLLWLHWGNYQNLLMAFQISLTLPVAIVGSILMILCQGRGALSSKGAIAVGACVCLLPLNGGHGLSEMPALMVWLVLAGLGWGGRPDPLARSDRGTLLVLAVSASILCGLYFREFVFPGTSMHAHGLGRVARVAAQFLCLAIGSAAERTWHWSLPLVVGLCSISVFLLVKVARERPPERLRAAGILAVFAGVVSMALSVGWGRGSVGWGGFAARYVSLPAMVLCCVYFTWCRYGSPSAGRCLQLALFLLMSGVFAINLREGIRYGEQRLRIEHDFESDLARGLSNHELAVRHADAFYTPQSRFEEALTNVQRARLPPFEARTNALSPDAEVR